MENWKNSRKTIYLSPEGRPPASTVKNWSDARHFWLPSELANANLRMSKCLFSWLSFSCGCSSCNWICSSSWPRLSGPMNRWVSAGAGVCNDTSSWQLSTEIRKKIGNNLWIEFLAKNSNNWLMSYLLYPFGPDPPYSNRAAHFWLASWGRSWKAATNDKDQQEKGLNKVANKFCEKWKRQLEKVFKSLFFCWCRRVRRQELFFPG